MKSYARHFAFNLFCALAYVSLSFFNSIRLPWTFVIALCVSYLWANPDIDNAISWLNHRSCLTHSALIPLLTFLLVRPILLSTYVSYVRLVLFLPFLSHLIGDFDVSPRGYGQISVFGKRIGKKGTLFWFSINVLGIIVFLVVAPG